jgi:DNA polymerase-3 subunit epsilon
MIDKKLLFLDVETTSLDPYNGAIIQIHCIIRINGKIKESFEVRMSPHEGAKIDVNENFNLGKKTESSERGLDIFIDKLENYVNRYDKTDKFYIVAYNAKFDCDHIRNWFRRCNHKWYGSYFWHPPIDVMGLALDFFYKKGKRHELINFKLGTVAEWFGLEVEKENLHDAKYDNFLTKDLYNKIRKFPKPKKQMFRVRKKRRRLSS